MNALVIREMQTQTTRHTTSSLGGWLLSETTRVGENMKKLPVGCKMVQPLWKSVPVFQNVKHTNSL